MKKAKIAFWVVLFAFIALILYQNRGFYLDTHSLGINLVFLDYHTPEIPNAVLFLSFFFVGLLISYFFSLLDRFKSKKMIKSLMTALEQKEKELTALQAEIETLKGNPPSHVEPEVIDVEKDSDAS